MSGDADITAALPLLLQRVEVTIGRDPRVWSQWPGGWRDEISTALIDAVFSARAVYETARGRGIKPLVERWRDANPALRDDLAGLREAIRTAGPAEWARGFGNEQHSPHRSADAPGGPTKAATIVEAAEALLGADLSVRHARDITDANVGSVKTALRRVPGIGYATPNYFLMLLGRPGVKPDRMVHRFVTEATARKWSDRDAEALVIRAAANLGVESHELEHAIWKHESDNAAGRGPASIDGI